MGGLVASIVRVLIQKDETEEVMMYFTIAPTETCVAKRRSEPELGANVNGLTVLLLTVVERNQPLAIL